MRDGENSRQISAHIASACEASRTGKSTQAAPWAVLQSRFSSALIGPMIAQMVDTTKDVVKASSSSIPPRHLRKASQPRPEMRVMNVVSLFIFTVWKSRFHAI